MPRILYFFEALVIFGLVAWVLLGIRGELFGLHSLTIPTISQAKDSIEVRPDQPNNNVFDFNARQEMCQKTQLKPVGFPFVYKSSDKCDRGASYPVGQFFNYSVAVVIALVITKLTSVAVSRMFDK